MLIVREACINRFKDIQKKLILIVSMEWAKWMKEKRNTVKLNKWIYLWINDSSTNKSKHMTIHGHGFCLDDPIRFCWKICCGFTKRKRRRRREIHTRTSQRIIIQSKVKWVEKRNRLWERTEHTYTNRHTHTLTHQS